MARVGFHFFSVSKRGRTLLMSSAHAAISQTSVLITLHKMVRSALRFFAMEKVASGMLT